MGTSQGVVCKDQEEDIAGAGSPSHVVLSRKSCPSPLLDNMEDFPGPDALISSFTFLEGEGISCKVSQSPKNMAISTI